MLTNACKRETWMIWFPLSTQITQYYWMTVSIRLVPRFASNVDNCTNRVYTCVVIEIILTFNIQSTAFNDWNLNKKHILTNKHVVLEKNIIHYINKPNNRLSTFGFDKYLSLYIIYCSIIVFQNCNEIISCEFFFYNNHFISLLCEHLLELII